ncbi:hypothetical protein [Helicobacter winghamensis]|uniref:hypothetical protein n=1 Tax=Helicobacter winghamensis TaxID=157268 RepID=UPI00351BC7DE
MIKTEWVLTKDIFPTLYALSLSGVKYLSLGGRDMLAKPKDVKKEFGFMHLFGLIKMACIAMIELIILKITTP